MGLATEWATAEGMTVTGAGTAAAAAAAAAAARPRSATFQSISEDAAAMTRALWLLLLLASTALLQTAAADEEPAAEERSEADGDDDSDDDDDDDLDCGADIEDGDGNGPSLDAHGIIELAEAARDPRSLVLGWRQYGDCEVFKKTVRRLKGFGRLHDVDVVVPRGNATITHVVARPAEDATGALRAERRGGGVGQTWVHLKLRAPRGFGLHYEVLVYGR